MSYSYNKKDKVLHDISFEMNPGEHLNIIGANGCGKSTLLKCICNFIEYEGSIKVKGREVKEFKPKDLAKEVSILSQHNDMYFDYKVIDVVKFGRYSYSSWISHKGHDNNELNNILSNMGIYSLKDRYMSELSGGEKQKVFIAKVLYQDPHIVLLDEFNNNLDLGSQMYILDNLKSLFKDKILISVFHDLNLVRNLDTKVMVLKDKKIYEHGDTDHVFKSHILTKVYGIDVEKFMIDSLSKWKKNREVLINEGGN